jgi:LPS-assembly protein
MRRPALFIALAALLAPATRANDKPVTSIPAATPGVPDMTITADHTENNLETGDTIMEGKAQMVDTGVQLDADQIIFHQKTQVAEAKGHVVLTRIGDRILADDLTYNRRDGTFTARKLRIGRYPFYIEGESAEGNRSTNVIVHQATVTYREPGPWQPTIRARTLTYSPGHYMRMAGANVGIGNYRPLPVSRMGQDLTHTSSFSNATLDGGYRHSLGAYADAALHIPIMAGVTAGPDIGVYTFRGIMLGPTANYDITRGDDTAVGFIKSGYIYDLGTRYTDILDNPVPASRAYAEWQHNQQISDSFSLNADINWSTDSEVIRDFHSKEFVPVQEPDNFLEAVYSSSNALTSVFTRFQPDTFYPVQQRLPEIRFDLLPTAIGGGVYVRFNSGVAHLEEDPPDGGLHLASDRIDTFLGISRPFTYKGIVDITPVAGARYTEYWDTSGALNDGGTSRALGELGFDADLKMSGTFNYENPLWHIDGLRHLFTPTLSYRYIPEGGKDAAWIPPIDRSTFTNYLPIMELGDMRAVDQLQASNVVRVGINNTLQTRDKVYGSRDLLTFNVDEDFRFQRAPGQTDFSDFHVDARATPAHWLELRFEDTVSTKNLEQRAVDTTLTVKESDVWSAGFGVGYLSDSYGSFFVPGLGYNPIVGVDTYHGEATYRATEVYELFVRGDYDARDHIFVDQYYGIRQRISNTWILQYAVVFSQGLNDHQGHFGVEVNLDIIRF